MIHSKPASSLLAGTRCCASGLLLPLLWIARRAPAATVAVLPADHFVWEEARFETHVRAALRAAAPLPDRLILLGVQADGPETSYGWITPGDPFAGGSASELYAVRRFWEKPDRRTAAHLFAAGCFWNTLVLAARLEAYLRLADACVPEVLAPLQGVVGCLESLPLAAALVDSYQRIRPTNLSRAMLARQAGVLLVLPARDVYWSDWGDPDRIVRTLQRFGRRPIWLAQYARVLASGPGNLT